MIDDVGLGMADGILQQAVLTTRLRIRLAVIQRKA